MEGSRSKSSYYINTLIIINEWINVWPWVPVIKTFRRNWFLRLLGLGQITVNLIQMEGVLFYSAVVWGLFEMLKLQPFDPGCLDKSELSLHHQFFMCLCSRSVGFWREMAAKNVSAKDVSAKDKYRAAQSLLIGRTIVTRCHKDRCDVPHDSYSISVISDRFWGYFPWANTYIYLFIYQSFIGQY